MKKSTTSIILAIILVLGVFVFYSFGGEKVDVCHTKTGKTHSVSVNAVDALVNNGNFTEGACGANIVCPCFTVEQLNTDFAMVMDYTGQDPHLSTAAGDDKWGVGTFEYLARVMVRIPFDWIVFMADVQKGNPAIEGDPKNLCTYRVMDELGLPITENVVLNISDDECDLCKDLITASDAWQ